MIALRKPVPPRMRVHEFLTWVPDDPQARRWEMVDREPVAIAPASETLLRCGPDDNWPEQPQTPSLKDELVRPSIGLPLPALHRTTALAPR